MAGFQTSEIIERPAEEVFAFIENTANVTKWLDETVIIEPLSEGPMRAGWRFKETRGEGRRRGSCMMEVRTHDGPGPGRRPPYRHAVGGAMMGVDAVYDFTFHALDARRTKLEVECRVTATNLFGRLLVGMFVKLMQKTDGAMVQRIKSAVEQPARG